MKAVATWDVEARRRTYLVEDGGAREVRDVVGDFEVAMGTGTLRVHHTFGDALTIEVSEEVDVVEVCRW